MRVILHSSYHYVRHAALQNVALDHAAGKIVPVKRGLYITDVVKNFFFQSSGREVAEFDYSHIKNFIDKLTLD